jgi:uncharacterized protein YfbU (UPF0304 family)
LIRCGGQRHALRIQQAETKGKTGSRIGSTEKYDSVFGLWHSCFAKYTIEDSYTPTHCDIISDIFHDGSKLFCHYYQKNWCTIQVPKQKQLCFAGCCAASMIKLISADIPEIFSEF